MNKLLIDIGNTWIRFYIDNQNFDLLLELKNWDEKKIEKEVKNFSLAIISNVRFSKEHLKRLFENLPLKVFFLDSETPLPIKLDYKTPKTLGKDRIATAVAAYYDFPNSNCIIIDIGTCITIDFLDAKGVFHGGRISPGLQMRLSAMNHFTGKLPLVERNLDIDIIGKSTEESLQSGAFYGILHEIEGTIHHFKQHYDFINVILTGGGAHAFDKRLKSSIFASNHFLVKGLKYILSYNEDK
ncbi:MAG: type III pantothenate kinase [Flavobacteriales bacterium]|jgi:type III pantothenate kinase|nr:type III pantothenate kinase [Flavobacteriales bacterium]